jgi:DnaJ-class molecular chaperone
MSEQTPTSAPATTGTGTQPTPGDDAPPGTPGTGEAVCRRCGGSGRLPDGQSCADCGGTGRVNQGIGGG